jgi:hypothetical protein
MVKVRKPRRAQGESRRKHPIHSTSNLHTRILISCTKDPRYRSRRQCTTYMTRNLRTEFPLSVPLRKTRLRSPRMEPSKILWIGRRDTGARKVRLWTTSHQWSGGNVISCPFYPFGLDKPFYLLHHTLNQRAPNIEDRRKAVPEETTLRTVARVRRQTRVGNSLIAVAASWVKQYQWNRCHDQPGRVFFLATLSCCLS